MTDVSIRTIENTWSQYNLQEAYLQVNGEAIPHKAIIRNEKFVAIVGDRYTLLPNEEAVKIADSLAGQVGLVPFKDFQGDWFNRMAENVVYSHGENRVHALYALNQPYEVQGDKMHVGVGIHNGIDGKT